MTEGPFDASMEEYPDEDMESPLVPERTAKSSTRTLVYMVSPDGYVEASEQSAEVELSDEFVNYF